MRRTAFLLIMLFVATPLLASPVHATHQYGHQFMVIGRIIGPDGEPAQNIPIRVTVETRLDPDPHMTIQTDCFGLFYTDNARYDNSRPPQNDDRGLEASPRGEVMHVHTSEYGPRSQYHVYTPYGNHSGSASSERQSEFAKIQLERAPPADEQCAPEVSFERSYVVAGKVQREVGATREDLRTADGNRYEINVTIQTTDGPVSETVFTTPYAEYVASFDNVTVTDGARVTVRWGDVTEEGRIDTTYRFTGLHILEEEPIVSETTRNVLLVLVGIIIVGGLGFWGFTTMKDRAELAKARQTTTRKRANK